MSRLLLLTLLAACAVAALAGPVIVTTYSDVGHLPTAPRHYRAATIVSEAELARYGPVPATQPQPQPAAAAAAPSPLAQVMQTVQQFVPDATLATQEAQLGAIIAAQHAQAQAAGALVNVAAAAPVAAKPAVAAASVAAAPAVAVAAPAAANDEKCFQCVSSWFDCKATCASRCPSPESWCTGNCVNESCGPRARDCYVSARCTQPQVDQATKQYPCRSCQISLDRCSSVSRMIHQCGDPWGRGASECYRDEVNICLQKAKTCHSKAACAGAAPAVNFPELLKAIQATAQPPATVKPIMRLAALTNPTAAAAPVAVAPPAVPAAPVAAVAAAAPAAPAAAPADVVSPADADPTPASGAPTADAPLDATALEAEREWAQQRDAQDLLTKSDDPQTDVVPPPPSLPLVASNGASKRDQFLALIRSKLGSKYVRGGTGPSTFDCSGLVYWAARQVGLSLPRTAHDQYTSAGKKVATVAARQPGDLIFFGKAGQRVYHVGVYVGPNQMINAPNSKSVVRQENYSYWPDRLITAKRIF